MVLGTDMSHHFAGLGDFRNLTVKHGLDAGMWHTDEKSIDAFRIMVLHTSDLANPASRFSTRTENAVAADAA